MKSSNANIDKEKRKITIPGKTFIKNLDTQDEFVTEKLEIEYNTEGKIEKIYGARGAGYITSFGEEPLKLKDKLFFEYSQIYLFSNKYTFENVKFSTCNLCGYDHFDDKHYILNSEKVDVIPEDKMILSNSKMFLYKKQIFGYKKLIIPLKRKKTPQLLQEDTSTFPKIGYNNTDGFFITKNFDYFFNNSNYGKILTKYGQYTGIYYGINSHYTKQIGKINVKFDNYLFVNNNKKFGNNFRNINTNLNLTGNQLNIFVRYSSNRSIYRNFRAPLTESISYGFTTNIKGINISYASSKTSTEKQFSSLNQFLRLSGNFKNFNFNFNLNDLQNTYFITNNFQTSQNVKLDLNYTFSKNLYTLSLLLDNTTNNYGFFGVNKLPELTLKLNKPIKFKDRITISPSIFLGKYKEPRFNRNTTKYQLFLNYSIQHIKDKDLNWTTNGIFKQNFFDTGKYYSDRNFHASYVHSFVSNFSLIKRSYKLNINYTYNFGKGFAPIFSDFTGKYQNLSANLSIFNNRTFDLNLSTNYNLNTGSTSPISVNFKYFPNNKFNASIFTTFDTKRSSFTNINTNIDWYISQSIRLTTWFNYNSFTKKIDYVDLVLIKDNHCWVNYIVYRSSLKQLYFYAYLKALPILGINIGIDQSKKFTPQY
ncbi:MAG: hypothetical protein RMJ36_02020 [Candidatus Calescibacterium sp.]|nr:hypothetical protein [Candidatus Calescibacterium sp.]MDW8132415.1 hypothetical protein [Candidatus Calescibacterium sp.]